ncbi:meiotic recombination [Coemansia sp. RSA 560]|nr:meiotic recombination [Coemansia sp. RSA 560]
MAHILTTNTRHIREFNRAGNAKMLRNILALQQNLSNIALPEEGGLDAARKFYELYDLGVDGILRHISEHGAEFSFDVYRRMVGFVYSGSGQGAALSEGRANSLMEASQSDQYEAHIRQLQKLVEKPPIPSLETDNEDTLSILVATDNHLGYMERDPVRGLDSFSAFGEILQLAQLHKADMVLLGGDLFHDNRPSRKCLHQAMTQLRRTCMGDGRVGIEHLSDPSVDFGPQYMHVNYEDPNINIALPVFLIHGNHDDPSGDGNLSAIDVLAVNGLVNYFGRTHEVDNIRVSPVLLRKGQTHLALFGLGNVRDERLHRTMARKHVTMCQPAEHADEWFNLMVLHQNRVAHGPKNHIPEHFLSSFLDLVVWGHEHQCQVDPEYNHQRSFYVSQPGSSVATALSPGEAVAKHVALLHINRRNFKLEKLRLKNVRPFVIEDVVLAAVPSLSPQSSESEIIEYLRQRVEAMILRAQTQYREQLESGHKDIEPALGEQPMPLVRVRVEYSGGFESFHPQRFGLLFADRVANPRDIVYFYRKPRTSSMGSQRTGSSTQETQASRSVPAPVSAVHVESLISEFLDSSSMQMLVDLELAEAIRLFVQKGDSDAIAHSLKSAVSDTQRRILRDASGVEEQTLGSQIEQARIVRREVAEANGHGVVDKVRDDAMAVTVSGKRSAINPADRKAIMAFEQIAVTAPGSDRDGSDHSGSASNSDREDNDEFRATGESLNPTKRTRATTRAPAKRSLTITNKRSLTITKKRTTASESADSDAVSESESESSDEFVTKPKPGISRPSRNARSTLETSRGSSLASSADERTSVAETPRAKRPRIVASPERETRASRGRGRGTTRGKRTTKQTTLHAFPTQSSSSSQMPVALEIDDDSGNEGAGFGRFSFNKK